MLDRAGTGKVAISMVELCRVELILPRRSLMGMEMNLFRSFFNSDRVGRDELRDLREDRTEDGRVTLDSELRAGTLIEGGDRCTLNHSK